ncbi:MAG: hypothetical protein HKN16_01835 [Saprospiraceae bacterium]|nr:hypothetical protein [Saprospiraceae bacterium]
MKNALPWVGTANIRYLDGGQKNPLQGSQGIGEMNKRKRKVLFCFHYGGLEVFRASALGRGTFFSKSFPKIEDYIVRGEGSLTVSFEYISLLHITRKVANVNFCIGKIDFSPVLDVTIF